MRFFNFFLIHMVQKYQNEIAPIFYYGKSPKTNEKDPKIPFLQPPDWGQPYWMTRYIKAFVKRKFFFGTFSIIFHSFYKIIFQSINDTILSLHWVSPSAWSPIILNGPSLPTSRDQTSAWVRRGHSPWSL